MAKKEKENKTQPVIGTGISGVDSFLNRPLASTIGDVGRNVGSGLSSAASGISSAVGPPLAATRDLIGGIRSPFDGMALIGRRDPAPLQFPADRYDPLKEDPFTLTPFQPRTTNSASMSQADAIAQNNANMTENQRRGYGLLSLSPSSANVAMAAYRGAPSGIAGGTAPTTFSPSFDQGIASSRFGLTQSFNQTPMAPVSTNITGATERKGVQTAYGMVYPADGQEAGAARSAALGPMGARYANVRQESNQADKIAQMRERGAAIGTRLAGEEDNRQKGLQRDYYSFRQGLEQDRFQSAMSQAEKSLARGESGRDAIRMAKQAAYGGEIMRQAGANVGTKNRTPFFSWERASMPSGEKFYRGDMGEYSRVVRDLPPRGGSPQPMTAAPQFGRANTTQRSWDNYVGPNPIKSFRYSGGA